MLLFYEGTELICHHNITKVKGAESHFNFLDSALLQKWIVI